VNNSSLRAAYYRLNTRENISIMLKLCEKHGVAVSLGSDAHFASAVGRFDEALALLEEISFPEELVANTSVEKFCALLARKTGCV
jgi:putative hydrolase